MAGHFLIVEARFYEEIVDAQVAGAIAALEAGEPVLQGFPYRVRWKFLELLPWLQQVTVTLMVMLRWAV